MNLLYLFCITALFYEGVFGLRCYICNSREDEQCALLTKDSKASLYYKECEDTKDTRNITHYTKPFCRKIYQKIYPMDNAKIIVRRCGFETDLRSDGDFCYSVSDTDHHEIACQCFTDGCNAAFKLEFNYNIIISIVILSYYFI